MDAGLVTLNSALSTHPALVSLDLGDCMLGDEALGLICGMLPPDGAKSGNSHLREVATVTLSDTLDHSNYLCGPSNHIETVQRCVRRCVHSVSTVCPEQLIPP